MSATDLYRIMAEQRGDHEGDHRALCSLSLVPVEAIQFIPRLHTIVLGTH